MNLIEALAWVVVELQSARPDMHEVRNVLEAAFIQAAKLDGKHQTAVSAVIRLAKVHGEGV